MWPKIVKDVKDFLLDESGDVPKKSVIVLGLLSGLVSAFSVRAGSTGYQGFGIAQNPDGQAAQTGVAWSKFDCVDLSVMKGMEASYNRPFQARGFCNEDDGDWSNDKCAIEVGSGDLFGNGNDGGTDGHSSYALGRGQDPCSKSWWEDNGVNFVTPGSCQLAVFNSDGSIDRDAVNEWFDARVSFGDITRHTNNLSFLSNSEQLTAHHAHDIIAIGNSACDYDVHIRACDCAGGCAGDLCKGCPLAEGSGGDVEVMIEYTVKYTDGTDVIPPYRTCWDQ